MSKTWKLERGVLEVLAHWAEPSPEQYALMLAYEKEYRTRMGYPPCGTHYVRSIREFVLFPTPAELEAEIPETPEN